MATRESIPPEVVQKARRALELLRTRAEALRLPTKTDTTPAPTTSAASLKTPRTP
jgi:hypothetical protein